MSPTRLLVACLTVLAGVVVPAPAVATTGVAAIGAVPGRYVVMLRADRVGTQGAVASARRLAGDAVGRVFGVRTPGFTAQLTPQAALRLAADPAVAVVEPDRVVRVATTQRRAPWNLDRIDTRSRAYSGTYTPSDAGGGVRAYVIDTGIRISHREFGGRASYGHDFVDGGGANDCAGHGTHVAATLGGARYGVAKNVRLVAVRVLGCDGTGLLSNVIAGVTWVTDYAVKPAVANLSIGGGSSAALDQAVASSIASGVTYAVAAGNEAGNACFGSPSDVRAAITVAATDRNDRRASFSNYGNCVDLFAPGVGIPSAVSSSNTATATMDGTSMAAPHVAGAAALILAAHPTYSPATVQTILIRQAATRRVQDRSGSPDRLLYVPPPPAAPVISTRTVAVGVHGRTYRTQLALGATRRGSWSLAAGTLPAGLRLSAAGVLSGTPTATGTRRVTVRFTDYVPQSTTRTLTVTVRPDPPVITTAALPTGVTGVEYTGHLSVAGGRAGTWSLAAGTLPTGLTLAANGKIVGIPTAAVGGTSLTVRFTDLRGRTATRALDMRVIAGL